MVTNMDLRLSNPDGDFVVIPNVVHIEIHDTNRFGVHYWEFVKDGTPRLAYKQYRTDKEFNQVEFIEG